MVSAIETRIKSSGRVRKVSGGDEYAILNCVIWVRQSNNWERVTEREREEERKIS